MNKENITIQDIAELAQVSKTTVSRYLNGHFEKMSDKTKEKIQSIINNTNYHVNIQAQSITKKETFIIGMIVADIENIFSAMLFKGADEIFEKNNYQIMLLNSDNSLKRERQLIERLLSLRVDGLIIQPMSKESGEYKFLQDSKIPVVVVDRKMVPEIWPMVGTDNYYYSKILVDYAVRLGYKKVIVVSEDVHANFSREDRFNAVVDKTKSSQVDVGMIDINENTTDQDIYNQIIEQTDNLHVSAALYALKGTLLMRVIHVLTTYQVSIPSEIGVAAFDDWDWATLMSPQITTVQQNPQMMGDRAATVLLGQLNNQSDIKSPVRVDSELVIRQSLIKQED